MTLKQRIIELLKQKQLTVEAAQKAGFKTYILHSRYRHIEDDKYVLEPFYQIDKADREGSSLLPRGGECEIELVDNESGVNAKAVSICSLADTYVKSVGIQYGIRRALREMLYNIRHAQETAE